MCIRDRDGLARCRVDITGLQTRAGQYGTLFCEAETKVTTRCQESDPNNPYQFPYDVSDVSNDLATKKHVQNCNAGDFVALALYVVSTEEKSTANSGEPYLEVHGVDMERAHSGPIRLWQHDQTDMEQGKVYIIRGLRVAVETYWSNDLWKYAPTGPTANV